MDLEHDNNAVRDRSLNLRRLVRCLPILFIAELFLILFLSSCEESSDKKKGDNEAFTALSKEKYEFELISVKADTNHKVMGVFSFRHNHNRSLKLWGFGFQNDGSFRTRFEAFRIKQDDEWKDVPVAYCGTGAEQFSIKPNKNYKFTIPLWPYVDKGSPGIVNIRGMKYYIESVPFETLRIQKTDKHVGQSPTLQLCVGTNTDIGFYSIKEK